MGRGCPSRALKEMSYNALRSTTWIRWNSRPTNGSSGQRCRTNLRDQSVPCWSQNQHRASGTPGNLGGSQSPLISSSHIHDRVNELGVLFQIHENRTGHGATIAAFLEYTLMGSTGNRNEDGAFRLGRVGNNFTELGGVRHLSPRLAKPPRLGKV